MKTLSQSLDDIDYFINELMLVGNQLTEEDEENVVLLNLVGNLSEEIEEMKTILRVADQ